MLCRLERKDNAWFHDKYLTVFVNFGNGDRTLESNKNTTTKHRLKQHDHIGSTTTMEFLNATDRALVEEFTWLPQEIDMGMVQPYHEGDINIPFENLYATMGDLDRVPTELMHMIFDDLTMADLVALRRTCRLTRSMVPGSLAYKDLTWYIPNVLRAMSGMELLGAFTVKHMMDTMTSHTCVGCGNFAVCIFLPEFSRVCYTCLQYNEAFWVMPMAEARKCFDLDEEVEDLIPWYWSIPGRYEMANEPPVYTHGRQKMVSVRAAKAFAMQLWGANGLKNHLLSLYLTKRPHPPDFKAIRRYKHLHDTPLEIGPAHHPPPLTEHITDENGWPGMGSMLVPVIIKQPYGARIVETGVWCRGCAQASDEWHEFTRAEKLAVKHHALREQRVFPTKDKVPAVMQSMEWATELYLNHAYNCYGLSLWKQDHYFPHLPHTFDFAGHLEELSNASPNSELDSPSELESESDASDVSMAS